jgi:DNA-3-methyladenine glycosylase
VDPAALIDDLGASPRAGVRLDADVITAACSLLGAVLRRGEVAVRLVEVEAYDGPTDPASHAHKGCTSRNWVMFGPPGHLYVYISYGIHHAANVAACPDGRGSGVLLRSGQVISGVEVARRRRGPNIADRDLARGPGRLTQALGITRVDNGTEVLGSSRPDGDPESDPAAAILLSEPTEPVEAITNGPRVGVSKAADRPWRFWIAGNRYVSAYRPATRRRP